MEEWDSGKVRPLEERIMPFLNSGKCENLAFSLPEIMKGLGYQVKRNDQCGMVHITNVKNALENLVKEGKAEKKPIKDIVGEETYYRATPIKEIRITWAKKTELNEDKGATGTSQ